MKTSYDYEAEFIRAVDGDTIDVWLDFGFSLKQQLRLRFADVNTPELNSKDEIERGLAVKAKEFTEKTLTEAKFITITTVKTRAGKERQTFGRYVAHVNYSDDGETWINLNKELVDEKLAVESKW